ncbi:hypothetical protein RJ639_023637 [Escallonia herrerae]|uniref:BED-type domain-containing protein n=1 Tax=Escallonia herrerae TaxID=1293975 RepID=A0AA88V0U8_9ASTE|nr:hypothetical protein RJ639_023637 [Escallonia herrerae]
MSSSRSAVKGKGKAVLRPSQIQLGGFDESPLWNHVKLTGGAASGGGNRHWMCNYCNKKVTGSYSKVKGHLLAIPLCGVTACKNLSAEIMKAIKKEHDDAERRKNIRILEARKQADYLTLPDGSDLLQNKIHKASGPLEKAFNVVERNIADKRAARMFYASALSFNLARSIAHLIM